MIPALLLLPHAALMLAGAPALAGLLWRYGSPHQAWRDLARLGRKATVGVENAALTELAPSVSLGASLLAAGLVPSFTLGMATAPLSDLILIGGLLALARAARVLAALESGAGLAALAGQRVALIRVVADPALLVLILVIAVATGTSNLDAASAVLGEGGLHWSLLPAVFAAAAVLLASVEPPELLSAFAGRDLALLQFAAQLRCLTVLSLVAALLLPDGLASSEARPLDWLVGAAFWVIKMIVLGAIGAGLGTVRARLRADLAPELAAVGLLLALLAACLVFMGQRPA